MLLIKYVNKVNSYVWNSFTFTVNIYSDFKLWYYETSFTIYFLWIYNRNSKFNLIYRFTILTNIWDTSIAKIPAIFIRARHKAISDNIFGQKVSLSEDSSSILLHRILPGVSVIKNKRNFCFGNYISVQFFSSIFLLMHRRLCFCFYWRHLLLFQLVKNAVKSWNRTSEDRIISMTQMKQWFNLTTPNTPLLNNQIYRQRTMAHLDYWKEHWIILDLKLLIVCQLNESSIII